MKHLLNYRGKQFFLSTHQASKDRTNYRVYLNGQQIGDLRTEVPTEGEVRRDYDQYEAARQRRLNTHGPRNTSEWSEVLKKPHHYPNVIAHLHNKPK